MASPKSGKSTSRTTAYYASLASRLHCVRGVARRGVHMRTMYQYCMMSTWRALPAARELVERDIEGVLENKTKRNENAFQTHTRLRPGPADKD